MQKKVRFVLTASVDDPIPDALLGFLSSDLAKHVESVVGIRGIVTASWTIVTIPNDAKLCPDCGQLHDSYGRGGLA